MVDAPRQAQDNSSLPLAGIRVLDFGWVWAAPVLGHILADMGAQVIKIESRAHLDSTRGGFPVGDRKEDPDWAVGFHVLNRNKLSVTLDLRTEEGKALLKRLVAVSDVVMENMMQGTMERLGLGYDEMREVRPDLVMLSISTIGQTGPLRRTPSYSPTAGAVSGMETLVGYEGERTLGAALAFMDPVTALHGVFALLATLEHRRKTGEGRRIDISLTETGVALTAEPLLDYQWNGRVWGTRGNMEPGYAPYNTYPSRGDDTWVAIAVTSEAEWQMLLDAMEHPSWVQDPRFADQFSRWKHRAELDELVGQWTATQDRDELVPRLQAAGVAASAGYRQSELVSREHNQQRQTFVTLDHPTFPGEIIYGLFWKLSDTPGALRRHAPLLGEHNADVLGGILGLSEEELRRLVESGVLY